VKQVFDDGDHEWLCVSCARKSAAKQASELGLRVVFENLLVWLHRAEVAESAHAKLRERVRELEATMSEQSNMVLLEDDRHEALLAAEKQVSDLQRQLAECRKQGQP